MKAIDVLRLMAGSEAGGTTSVDIGDNVAYSLMLDSASSQYLSRTFGTPTTQDTFTISIWLKRGKLSVLQNMFGVSTNNSIGFPAADTLVVTLAGSATITTSGLYRDPAAHCHVVYRQTTGSAVLEFNGASVGTSATVSSVFNTAVAHQLGAANTSNYFDGYFDEIIFVDGQNLAASNFGRTSADTGAWVHKTYAGTYGNNGFKLDFSNSADLGNDVSGNNNDWTTNGGISSANQYIDTPTNNFCVLNPLDVYPVGAGTIAKGNTKVTVASSPDLAKGSVWVSTGKWVAELTVTTVGTTTMFCLTGDPANPNAGTGTYAGYLQSGNKEVNGSASAYGASYTTGDVIRAEWNADTGNLEFFKNGTSQGSISSVTGTRTFAVYMGASNVSTLNFGAQAWTGTPTSGFVGLSTANLTAPAILDPAEYVNVKGGRSGTSATANITGYDFKPDMFMSLNRAGAHWHVQDCLRNPSGVKNKELTTSTNAIEGSTNSCAWTANADGYSFSDGSSTWNPNTTGNTYDDYFWRAGGPATANNVAGVGNVPTAGSVIVDGSNYASSLAGSIAATRITTSTTAGFSIVSYTGDGGASATLAHCLGAAPDVLLVKNRDVADDGSVYHSSMDTGGAPKDYFMKLFAATGAADKSNVGAMWNDTAPTTSVFSVGTEDNVNALNEKYIAYCWRSIDGFSKFGYYTGNLSTDGPFVFCGFRPLVVICKSGPTGDSYLVYDTRRLGYNVQSRYGFWDRNLAEGTTRTIDIISNGFKIRDADTKLNASGERYIFWAWAELPFNYATAR